jgi:hypothetical protein
MFSYAYMFARIYSRLADGTVAVMSHHPGGRHIAIRTFEATGAVHEAFFTETQMEDMRNTCHTQLPWQGFFELIQRSFAEHTITFEQSTKRLTMTVRHERATDQLPFPSFSATIAVKLTVRQPAAVGSALVGSDESPAPSPRAASEGLHLSRFGSGLLITSANDSLSGDVYETLCDEMISYALLRSGDASEAARLDQISRREAALAGQVSLLEAELYALESEMSSLAITKEYCTAVDAMQRDKDPRCRELEPAVREILNQDRFLDACLARADDPMRPHVEKLIGPLLAASGTFRKALDGPLLQAIKGQHVGPDHHSLRCCDLLLTVASPLFTSSAASPPSSPPSSSLPVMSPTTAKSGSLSRSSSMRQLVVSAAGSDARTKVWTALTSNLNQWCLDLFALHQDVQDLPVTMDGSGGKAGALVMLGYALFFKTGLVTTFNLSEQVLLQWLSMVEAKHGESSRRSRGVLRAASTLHAVCCLVLAKPGSGCVSWRPEEVLALMLAACTVGFCCDTSDYLHSQTHSIANTTFLDMHPSGSSAAFMLKELMKLPRYDLLQCVPHSQRREVETMLFAELLRHSDDPFLALEASIGPARSSLNALANGEISNGEAARVLMPAVLLAADMSIFARDEGQYNKWARWMQMDLIEEGTREAQAGVPPQPFRGPKAHTASVLAKNQLCQINCIVAPLYAVLFDVAPTVIRDIGVLIGKNRWTWANAEESEALGQSWK